MANTVYISAGLSVSKDEAVVPSGNTVYIAAGLTPAVEEETPPAGLPIPVAVHHYKQQGTG